MSNITALLQAAAAGQPQAAGALFEQLYPDIKRLARVRLSEVGGVTGLNATALVHEGFLRMAEHEGLRGESRVQFFAYVGRVLRSVVIDHLRARHADKRGGDAVWVTLSQAEHQPATGGQPTDLIDLDRAFERMRGLDAPLYELLEMQVFAGVTPEEVAELRGVTLRTVQRDLVKARALLALLLGQGAPAG